MANINQQIQEYLNQGKTPKLPKGHYINGAFVAPINDEYMPSYDAGFGRAFADFASGDASDVERAVESAEQGLKIWRKTSPMERRNILSKAGELLRKNSELFAFIEALDAGKSYNQAMGDALSSARIFEYYASVADTMQADSIPLNNENISFTMNEPVGITAHIIPWNYPLNTFVRGIAPALAAGCSVVAKPAETSPFTALMMAELLTEAGLPNGVVNVITGLGSKIGASLVSHPKIRHVTFTGSVQTGVHVAQSVAKNITSLTLELGGKSPLIALDDCNIDSAVEGALWAIFENAGQICSAGSRLIVHRKIKEEFLAKLSAKAAKLSVGHGLKNADVGAINSQMQRDKIANFVVDAQKRGRKILIGGNMNPDDSADTGWFYRPTIIDDLPLDDACVQDEIFGPVLSVQVFDKDDEAITLANGTNFGLMTGVYTQNINRAMRFAREIDAGQITINEYWAGGVAVPFGGNKKSGYGREKGLSAVQAYSAIKAITMKII